MINKCHHVADNTEKPSWFFFSLLFAPPTYSFLHCLRLHYVRAWVCGAFFSLLLVCVCEKKHLSGIFGVRGLWCFFCIKSVCCVNVHQWCFGQVLLSFSLSSPHFFTIESVYLLSYHHPHPMPAFCPALCDETQRNCRS